jgi:ubiquinone/menaquinone biosynthesis C-methylase UbiE
MPSDYSPVDVRDYYNAFTRKYLNIYGDVIQAFRPKKEKDLLNYIAVSSGLKWKTKIVDAGCGVCGPARYFAKKFNSEIDAITISEVQKEEAEKKIRQDHLEKNIKVVCGDFHQLTSYFEPENYDAVYFLESLGHSNEPGNAIKEACKILKKSGYIYIKDFYKKEVSDPAEQEKINKVIGNMNKHYCYNTLDLLEVIRALRNEGFIIDFIKKFDFKDDTKIRANFEKDMQIDVFEGLPEFAPAEWLEIKCIKSQ